MLMVGIDLSEELRKPVPEKSLKAAVTLWARGMDSMLRVSPNATLKPRDIECSAPRQTRWNDGQQLLRFTRYQRVSSHRAHGTSI